MAFTLRSGNKPGFKNMGLSPLKESTNYSEEAQNLLKAVPDKEAYDRLSDADKVGFDKAAKKHGLPMVKKSPTKQIDPLDLGLIDEAKKVKVNKYPKNFNVSGKDKWVNQSKDILSRNKPSKLIKVPDVDVINKKLTKIGKGTTKKVVKKGLGKTILKGAGKVAKFAAKRLGPVGAAITAYEVGKTIPKVAKATVKGLKKEAKTGSAVGKPKY